MKTPRKEKGKMKDIGKDREKFEKKDLTKGGRYDIITGLSERDGLKSEDEAGKGKPIGKRSEKT